MYRVKVVGTYIARQGKDKVKKNYEVEGNIPTMKAALSVVKNKLLTPALTSRYPDYVTFLTYHIVSTEPLTQEAKKEFQVIEPCYMDRPTLLRHIKDLALPVDPNYYPDLFKLREAVQDAKEDPEGYKKRFEIHKEDLMLDVQMAKCNPQLFPDSGVTPGFAGSVNLSPSAKPKVPDPETLQANTQSRLGGLAADQIRDGEMAPADEPSVNVDDL